VVVISSTELIETLNNAPDWWDSDNESKHNAVVLFEEQAKNWSEEDRELYYDTLAQCDDVIMLNTSYKPGCYFQRNRYMVDNSSKLICYYDGGRGDTEYTVRYAEKSNLQVINLFERIK